MLGVVDTDGRFLAVYPGVEGCASDCFVYRACSDFSSKSPPGCFYLADAGYTLTKSILTPYRSTRYHLREWAEEADGRPRSPKEVFNYRHSKARIIVEQAFGVLKRKWGILTKPMELELELVNVVIHTCCALHNFVLSCNLDDIATEATESETDDGSVATQHDTDEIQELSDDLGGNDGGQWRDSLANDMWNSYMLYRQSQDGTIN